ncbi:MAG: hypothetical protein GC160_19555 [Acidobacteria bacterium]|nr:hypothetical protein [Acidobacteriota bacterium]
MALFNDGFAADIADLLAYESDLQDVATTAGIDLSTKLRLAQTEVGAQIAASSRRPGNVFYGGDAGWQSTGGEASLPRFDLSQVIVTPPLRLWLIFQALALTFRDAQTRKENDKYLPKWREYRELAKWAADLLFQTGVGLSATPIPRPDQPDVSSAASTLPAMAAFVRITWTRGADESAGSLEKAVRTGAGQAIELTAPNSPAGVTGWNVYVGRKKGEALLQTEQALEVGTPWTMPESGIALGKEIGEGQAPDLYRTAPRYLQRG